MDNVINCPICGEGDAHLKFVETIYFYNCTKCGSDFADSNCTRANKDLWKVPDKEERNK